MYQTTSTSLPKSFSMVLGGIGPLRNEPKFLLSRRTHLSIPRIVSITKNIITQLTIKYKKTSIFSYMLLVAIFLHITFRVSCACSRAKRRVKRQLDPLVMSDFHKQSKPLMHVTYKAHNGQMNMVASTTPKRPRCFKVELFARSKN